MLRLMSELLRLVSELLRLMSEFLRRLVSESVIKEGEGRGGPLR